MSRYNILDTKFTQCTNNIYENNIQNTIHIHLYAFDEELDFQPMRKGLGFHFPAHMVLEIF